MELVETIVASARAATQAVGDDPGHVDGVAGGGLDVGLVRTPW